MRKEYEMNDEQLEALLDASRPTPVMFLSGGRPMGPSPRENANYAWKKLGDELGFNWHTVQPVSGKCQKHFTAVEKEA